MKKTEMFCHFEGYKKKADGSGPHHAHFATHEFATKCYGEGNIVKALVRELHPKETSDYWAWWNNEKKEFNFVYPAKLLTTMCFPNIEVSIERGQGLLINVKVEVL